MIAYPAVALNVPWNRKLFSEIAQRMGIPEERFFRDAWKYRSDRGESVRNDGSSEPLYHANIGPQQ